jgi:hypothetical protein
MVMLVGQASVTELIDLLDFGQPTYPFLRRHLLQALEVEMPQPRVPAPCDLLGPSHVADQSCNVGDMHV